MIRLKHLAKLIAFFIISVPVSATAKSWSNCIFEDVMAGIDGYELRVGSIEELLKSEYFLMTYKSYFPKSFSFNENEIVWCGRTFKLENRGEGKFFFN